MKITKIFASDMDGTFLRMDHQFDRKRFKKVIQSFKEKGYLFVVASGRPLLNLKHLFAEFLDEIAIVAENGSVVYYKGEILYQAEPMNKQLVLDIIDSLEKSPYASGLRTIVSGLEGAFVLDSISQTDYDFISHFYLEAKRVKSYQEIEVDVIKLVAAFEADHLESAQAWLNDHFKEVNAVTTGGDSVDIILDGGHKAIGLEMLCQHLGLQAKDVIAFGDNENDLEMLSFASIAFATENAKESVKTMANQVLGPCDEEPVMAYLEEICK
ncbi:Cof-type HAD-IIB family hydrolase [Streptococcus sp. DD13]|uniref:Cof-type HAD-IIB family hydrolase n=1 Tax=Streptococcus sp. DD13 TaxID=1777881 RepID=UPI000791D736|nr:HAD family hydrolase [Streptococcus sp. DD13]KXT79220.1 Hydrolase (HAD superfamily) [Streptococcus sp. DD13]